MKTFALRANLEPREVFAHVPSRLGCVVTMEEVLESGTVSPVSNTPAVIANMVYQPRFIPHMNASTGSRMDKCFLFGKARLQFCEQKRLMNLDIKPVGSREGLRRRSRRNQCRYVRGRVRRDFVGVLVGMERLQDWWWGFEWAMSSGFSWMPGLGPL